MSATNRGGKRLKDDTYVTPAWAFQAMIPWLWKYKARPKYILEPGAGRGELVKEIRLAYPKAKIHAIEKRRTPKALKKAGADIVTIDDYLAWPRGRHKARLYDLAVGNPPYSLAMEFIQHALEHSKMVCFLLRLNFLASKTRAPWLSKHTPAIHVLPKRPGFIPRKPQRTDACEYGWFVWARRGHLIRPEIKILEVPE